VPVAGAIAFGRGRAGNIYIHDKKEGRQAGRGEERKKNLTSTLDLTMTSSDLLTRWALAQHEHDLLNQSVRCWASGHFSKAQNDTGRTPPPPRSILHHVAVLRLPLAPKSLLGSPLHICHSSLRPHSSLFFLPMWHASARHGRCHAGAFVRNLHRAPAYSSLHLT
jgi:hypothetical protein